MFSQKHLKLTLLAILFLATPILSHGLEQNSDAGAAYKCTHDSTEHPEPEVVDPEMYEIDSEGRLLAATSSFTTSASSTYTPSVPKVTTSSTSSTPTTSQTATATGTPTISTAATSAYPSFRLKASYNALGDDKVFNEYVENSLIPPIIDYMGGALRVKYPLAPVFGRSAATTCNVPTSPDLKAGVAADFYWVLKGTAEDSTATYLADSYACYLMTASRRPYIGRTIINRAKIVATKDVLVHEKNMVCMIHELVHTLGFAKSLYNNFVDSKGVRLTNHVLTESVNGVSTSILNVEPLTSKLRAHFGCSTLKGAYLENDGPTGTSGSHFDRRHFAYEFMTSGLMFEMQVSPFTLALLEGSGWYVADYTYAENFLWGQGQGCDFLFGTCSATKYDEFCTNLYRRCTPVGTAGGTCQTDSKSSGCRFQRGKLSYHCQNPDAVSNARLPAVETFGRTAGSRCFTGNLVPSTSKTTSQSSYCFKYTCSGTGTKTKLTLSLGTTSVPCLVEGPKTVAGFKGTVNCPDPISYCATTGKITCPRNCMGRGTCTNGKCVCKTGFTGLDCGLGPKGL